ncbi:MAG: hypothetical protein M0C28_00920 [Candidatus Moduliflexus flocculans]|nr:hypothetical protein [Candidatus Moduliflexus flocculans]
MISAMVVSPTTTSVALPGLNQVLWKRDEVVPRQPGHRSFRARPGEGGGVGVARAVDEPGQDPQGHVDRRVLLLADLGDLDLLEPVEVRLREGRVENHVGEDVEGRVELVLERGERHLAGVEPGARPELGARAGPAPR